MRRDDPLRSPYRLQGTSVDDLRSLWRRVEDLGFHWISIWDHFYGATGQPEDAQCLEAVSMDTALALETTRVQRGALVYSIGYRHPAVLPRRSRPSTCCLVAGRRSVLGPGGPRSSTRLWNRIPEHRRTDGPARGRRRGTAPVAARRSHRLRRALVQPGRRAQRARPAQARLPIWIGVSGEKRTPRVAAQSADGWNVPFVSPETFARRRDVLHQHCAVIGRQPSEIACSVNVGLAWSDESVRQQFGGVAELVKPGVLGGSIDEVVQRIGEYVDAGADQVNIALPAPFDIDSLEQFADAAHLEA